jgi:C4-type Zn-finger protein
MKIPCPICDTGTLVERREYHTAPYKGFRLNVPVTFSHCDHCESDSVTGVQVLKNKQTCMAMKASLTAHLHQITASSF